MRHTASDYTKHGKLPKPLKPRKPLQLKREEQTRWTVALLTGVVTVDPNGGFLIQVSKDNAPWDFDWVDNELDGLAVLEELNL